MNRKLFAVLLLTLFLVFSVPRLAKQVQYPEGEKAPTGSTPVPCDDTDNYLSLVDDKNITAFNGRTLDLGFDNSMDPEELKYSIDSSEVVLLEDGGLLVSSFWEGLTRFDKNHRIVWTYPKLMVLDFEYIEATNLIYVTAGDNNMFILNASTGAEEFRNGRNGSAAYGVAKKYRTDTCLITDNFSIYRERSRAYREKDPMKDGISCWRGTTELWHLEFPPDAELVVSGDRILAVTKSTKRIYVQEIIPPPGM